ncbi:MAG: EF-hand domain-containing protein, partial [Bacteroidota bacterium]|nr:EF-hand domain-containing protein [Bacteroidota bacterium]
DKQPHSNPNAIVDENGIEISPDHLALALDTAQAIKREDVEAYLQTILGAAKYYKKHGSVTIPEKFKALDTNHDGYISYEELLKTINDYFDFKNNMSNKDIGELTDFFFTQ